MMVGIQTFIIGDNITITNLGNLFEIGLDSGTGLLDPKALVKSPRRFGWMNP